jgi:hypothetical protein
MTSPDTTEAVVKDVYGDGAWAEDRDDVAVILAADRKALAEQGYVIVRVGEVPPWMEPCGHVRGIGEYRVDVEKMPFDLYRIKSDQ